VECCNLDEDSLIVLRLSWKGRIFGEIKSGQTVDILLDCVDIVGFGAQELLIDIVD